jgi:ferredoxin
MLRLRKAVCTECGACVPVCHVDALRLTISGIEIDMDRCDLCEICVLLCPTEALLIEEKQHETV